MKVFEEVNKELGTDYKSDSEIRWYLLSIIRNLPKSFIEKYFDKLDWSYISIYQELSESFIEKWKDKVDWALISKFQKLSENFIEKYKDKLNWKFISQHQFLSEQIIENCQDKIDWSLISKYQFLSESFMEKYKDKVNWSYISKYQRLSKKFIDKYKNKINIYELKKNVLTQTDINKDWFVAYVHLSDQYYNHGIIKYNIVNAFEIKILLDIDYILKVRIYYKDLTSTVETKKIECLRKCNKNKIYGKKKNRNI